MISGFNCEQYKTGCSHSNLRKCQLQLTGLSNGFPIYWECEYWIFTQVEKTSAGSEKMKMGLRLTLSF